ncbi:YitT family protein [Demequina sp. NBRC 110054]|uniref:YitT family protein n=1 Tax=Demequina sp. NBRC 110054 TaxID=1570343 RepID=UPI001F404FD1|nr:YitT family protein [Demequina sp. NBRC 110054]
MTVIEPPLDVKKHALWEDALALVVGAFMMSWGIYLLKAIAGVSGGLAGVAFLTTYLTGWGFGVVYFVINLPFYYLAVKRLGWTFTIKTLIAVALVSIGSSLHPHFIEIGDLSPMYAAIFAGLSIGMGMLVLFRHGASAGGFGILAAYAQERFNIRAGYVQGALDLLVVLASLALVDWWILLCSIVGAVLLNFVIAINHRPGRYFG